MEKELLGFYEFLKNNLVTVKALEVFPFLIVLILDGSYRC